MRRGRRGITLIELLVSIAIATVITAAIYFSLDASLESWSYSRDQLSLQKVLSSVLEEIFKGTPEAYGIKDVLEVREARENDIEFVLPWTDDTHTVASKGVVYRLNRKMKPGTSLPIAEVKLPSSDHWGNVSLKRVELQDSARSQVRLGQNFPAGSKLRFIYHPDADVNTDVIQRMWWDKDDGNIYFQDQTGIRNISKNSMEVKITDMKIQYYDNLNQLINEYSDVDSSDLSRVSGVEVVVEAERGQYKQSVIGFSSLSNAPARSGYIAIKKGMSMRIPDGDDVHTLLLANISGVKGGDEIAFEVSPSEGKDWRITIKFSRPAHSIPRIASYTIEYPIQKTVYMQNPNTDVTLGLDLLTLGTQGLYDYDNDEETDDVVLIKGEATLKVYKMDVEGAGLFVRP